MEYLTVRVTHKINLEEEMKSLNDLGAHGWNLIQIMAYSKNTRDYYFSRVKR